MTSTASAETKNDGVMKTAGATVHNTSGPCVSILTICRNSEQTIRRCIESVLSQTYARFEYIIQDGDSTDRTLDIISEYPDPRIKLVSEPDRGGTEAFFKALSRCTGDIITLCWADEELLPHAVAWGVTTLADNPRVAAVYGDVYCTDIDGNIDPNSQPATAWDMEKFTCWEIMPNYCASFMRSECLKQSGFFKFTGSFFNDVKGALEETNCVMYDYFAMVGIHHPILYVPFYVGKFSVHPGQLSSSPKVLFAMLQGLFRSIDRLCDDPQTPNSIKNLRLRAYAGVHLSMINSLLVNARDIPTAKNMLSNALQYRPDQDFLAKVCTESCNHLLEHKHTEQALSFTAIIEAQGPIFPGFRFIQATASLEAGRIKVAREAIGKGLAEDPTDPRLLSLEKQLQDHQKWEATITHQALHSDQLEVRKLMGQLRQFLPLTEHHTRMRLGQIMNAGISSDSLMAAVNILCWTTCKREFLTTILETSSESRLLIERTLAAFLLIAIETNASELSQRLSATLAEYYAKKEKNSPRHASMARSSKGDTDASCRHKAGQRQDHYPPNNF